MKEFNRYSIIETAPEIVFAFRRAEEYDVLATINDFNCNGGAQNTTAKPFSGLDSLPELNQFKGLFFGGKSSLSHLLSIYNPDGTHVKILGHFLTTLDIQERFPGSLYVPRFFARPRRDLQPQVENELDFYFKADIIAR